MSFDLLALQLLLASGMRLSIPIAYAALGETISQKSGMLNLSLTAMMTAGAFAAVIGSDRSGNAWIGILFGIAAGVLVASIQAGVSIYLQASQVLVGLALHIAVLGATATAWRGIRHGLFIVDMVVPLKIPILSDIPVLGPVLFEQRPLVYLLYFLIPLVAIVLKNTYIGLAIQAAGEAPQAADSAGVAVNQVRFFSVLVCGGLAGLAGGYMSVGELGTFSDGMIAGRGWIAIAAVIFGRWAPVKVAAASFVFGLSDAVRFALPHRGVDVPPQLLIILPYVVALLAMAGLSGGARGPAWLTRPFKRST